MVYLTSNKIIVNNDVKISTASTLRSRFIPNQNSYIFG